MKVVYGYSFSSRWKSNDCVGSIASVFYRDITWAPFVCKLSVTGQFVYEHGSLSEKSKVRRITGPLWRESTGHKTPIIRKAISFEDVCMEIRTRTGLRRQWLLRNRQKIKLNAWPWLMYLAIWNITPGHILSKLKRRVTQAFIRNSITFGRMSYSLNPCNHTLIISIIICWAAG